MARVGFDADVGVFDVREYRAGVADTEKIGEAEVGAARAVFVIERGLERRQEAAAAADVLAELLALGVGERRGIGEEQQLKAIDMVGIEQSVVDHFEGSARLDEGLI